MSNIIPYQAALEETQRKFVDIATKADTGVVYEIESMFALQSLAKNDFLAQTANKNLNSLRNAIINVASIGLSLNPAMQYAYLVPREGGVCLDISYKGLIKLATDTGSMLWVRADLVYKNDTFKYHGPAAAPEHVADVFGDRGEFSGVYCIAKTIEGDILAEIMNAAEVYQVRDASMAWVKQKKGPWKDWFGEMAKKSIIKRASKTWPRSDKNDRLAQAVQVINEHEGIDFDQDKQGPEKISESQLADLTLEMEGRVIDLPRFLKYAEVESLDQITVDKFPAIVAAVQSKPIAEKVES
jgi:recombination protein RecT